MTGRLEVVPTRSMLQELEADHRVVREGREFLDQKRMLLATEMLRRLDLYEQARRELDETHARAVRALAEAVARHGLDGVLCQPAPLSREADVELHEGAFLGVPVAESRLVWPSEEDAAPPTSNPSPEARRCRAAFRALLEQCAAVAGQSSTLERLRREYRQTERRTRALEDVLEPEIGETVQRVRDELDELDQEEAVRARSMSSDRTP